MIKVNSEEPKIKPENSSWQNRQEMCIAQGSLTNSKHADCFIRGVYPTHILRAKGIDVWTHDNNRYLDFICGLGSSFLGFGNERINISVKDQLTFYGSYSLPSTLEVEVAEKVKEMFPVIEKLKFLKTGSEACLASIKIARAYTGRKLILSDGYHGMGDEFISLNPNAQDVGSHYDILPLMGNEDKIAQAAAVIIEPVITKFDQERIEWLSKLRQICTDNGSLLIYDEIVTGLRFKKYSVAKCTGIKPDLICLGKAIGNGYPISVVGGRSDLMDNPNYFVSSTYAGDTVSLSAMKAVLDYVSSECDIDELWNHGEHFWNRFNAACKGVVQYEGYPTRGALIGEELPKALFMQEMCRAGILIGPSPFFIFQHIDKADMILSIVQDVSNRIRMGSVKLLGSMPKKPLAQLMRNQ